MQVGFAVVSVVTYWLIVLPGTFGPPTVTVYCTPCRLPVATGVCVQTVPTGSFTITSVLVPLLTAGGGPSPKLPIKVMVPVTAPRLVPLALKLTRA